MSNVSMDFVSFDLKVSIRSNPRNMLAAFLGALCLVAEVPALSCGKSATLVISAPSSAAVSSPITVTVTAMIGGNRDKIFNSPIHFTSSDGAAVLPADYELTAADAGSYTFTNGVTFMTPGKQTVTATDRIAPSITATADFMVSAATGSTQF